MKLGVIGAGYWGSKIVQSVGPKISVTVLDVKNGDHWQNDQLDAVIIATPPDQHYTMSRWYLEQGKHVLCEKPTAVDTIEQAHLNKIAQESGSVYQAGHILLFQPSIQEMLRILKDHQVRHIESRRLNWGRLQTNLNLAWHLAPHDISVIDQIDSSRPSRVWSLGYHLNRSPKLDYNTYDLTYHQFNATITLGWHWPKKVREFVATCEDLQMWVDDEQLHVIEGGWDKELNNLRRTSERVITFNPTQSPLQAQIQHFISCIEQGTEPLAGPDHMLRVVDTVQRMGNGI